jgi:hypothetical protein
VARALVLAGFLISRAVADDVMGATPAELEGGLLSWDGAFYRAIAEGGYASVGDAPVRFFPLYPLLGRYLGFGGWEGPALVVLSNVAALALGVLVRRLVLREKDDPELAARAVWLTMLVPPAFVLVFGYAEALFLVGAVSMFLALRTERWWWAAFAGAAAALTRPTGLLLVLPAVVEVARHAPRASWRPWVGRAAAVLGPVAGTGLYAWWAHRATGDALEPFRLQEHFRGEVVDPVTRLLRGVGDLAGSETFGDGLHLPFALALVALAALTFRYWPASYGLYAAAVVVTAVSSENLNSIERYGLNAFPLILTLAVLVAAPRLERATLALAAGGFVAFTSLALLGAYVP